MMFLCRTIINQNDVKLRLMFGNQKIIKIIMIIKNEIKSACYGESCHKVRTRAKSSAVSTPVGGALSTTSTAIG